MLITENNRHINSAGKLQALSVFTPVTCICLISLVLGGSLCKIFVLGSGSGRINSIEESLVVLVFMISVVWSALLHLMTGLNSLILMNISTF